MKCFLCETPFNFTEANIAKIKPDTRIYCLECAKEIDLEEIYDDLDDDLDYNFDVLMENFLIELCRVFNKYYSDAEFGPGHLVLSDYNWDGINFCFNQINLLRQGKSETYDETNLEGLDEVEAFLKFLKVITDKYEVEQTL